MFGNVTCFYFEFRLTDYFSAESLCENVPAASQNCVTSTKRLPLSEYGLRLVSKKFPTGKVARGKAQILCSFFGFRGSFSLTGHSTRHAICDLIFSLGFDLRTCCALCYNYAPHFLSLMPYLGFFFCRNYSKFCSQIFCF